jgi:hypothetical protein
MQSFESELERYGFANEYAVNSFGNVHELVHSRIPGYKNTYAH